MLAESNNCFITQLVETFRFDDGKLPSLPNAVIYLENAIRDDSVSLKRLAELLGSDPVLAARLIRVANSAYYRSVIPVESVPEAVFRIGFSATRNISLVLLQNSFKARHQLVADMVAQLWSESLKTAAIASALSSHYRLVDANRAMLGGLMYNVGAMLLLTKIDEKVQEIRHPIILQHMLAKHAPTFGLKLLQHWEMDPDLQEVVVQRDNWQREFDGPPDLADFILVARRCATGPDGVKPDLAECEQLPSYIRMHTHLHLTQSLATVVAEAEEVIQNTLDMLSDGG